jgi:drug/metabolite transporter (DMT)-like permease
LFAIVIALAAAFFWGCSAVLVRTGLKHISSTATGTLISLASGLVFTWLLVLLFQLEEAKETPLKAILLFAVIGVLNFPIGRFFNYMSMSRLGVGRSTPILASAPFFAMVLAVIFTGEDVDLATLAGAGLILAGLYVTIAAPRPRQS